ncbi:MAG: FAD-dependent monooxygenase, partial [Gemmatimonadaceae bacterium]
GRDSTMRAAGGLKSQDFGAPMDVLWMRISRNQDDPSQLLGRIDYGQIFVMIERGDYWQCGLVVPKGSFAEIKQRGLGALRDDIRRLAPFLGDRVNDLREWNDVKLLTVQVDRLRSWHRPGLLCIGDAAHAMSPIGGVGINLAIQDAVAAGNILAPALRSGGAPSTAVLDEVQKRRELPTRVTQRAQLLIQNAVITRVLGRRDKKMSPPWIIRVFAGVALMRRIPARLVGLGFRREHVNI